MSAYTEWLDRAMILVDEFAEKKADAELENDQGTSVRRLRDAGKAMDAARAALAEHLASLPMGEPCAWQRAPGQKSILRDVTPQKCLPNDVPLYRHPKDSA